jgi:hypothetical protein
VVVSLWIASSALAADPFYGMFTTDLNAPSAQLQPLLDAQATTGVGLLREHVYWDQIERSPGVFDFTALDALVGAAAQRGMTVLPILTSTPQFYSSRPVGLQNDGWPPVDPSHIFAFAYQLTHRYGVSGTFWGCVLPGLLCRRAYHPVTAWQVWNEPDLPAWWRTGVSPVAYLRLLQFAYLGLKLGDPASEVVLGGLSLNALLPGGYLQQLYTLGAAPFFDTLAIHPYAANVATVIAHIQTTRQIAAANNDANVPIRVSEYGFATGGASPWTTNPACQAALLSATTLALSARRTELGLRSIVQLQWQDRAGSPSPWPNHAGLLFADGAPKPALAAFTNAVHGIPMAPGSTVADVCEPEHQG